MLTIKNHRIVEATQHILDTAGSLSKPRYLICHYTAGGSISGSLETLKANGTSYHVLIDRDGTLYQVAPFDVSAAHAGVSNWKGVDGLNEHSIGISLANYGGWLKRMTGGTWRAPGGAEFDEDEVLQAEHHIGLTAKTGWERFTEVQLAAADQVVRAIVAAYPTLIDAVGHDEIAMGRREDPGPAFPWASIRSHFPRRGEDLGPLMTVKSPDGRANLRQMRSASSTVVDVLPNGTELHLRSVAYRFVTVPGTTKKKPVFDVWASVARKGSMDHAGFINRGLLV